MYFKNDDPFLIDVNKLPRIRFKDRCVEVIPGMPYIIFDKDTWNRFMKWLDSHGVDRKVPRKKLDGKTMLKEAEEMIKSNKEVIEKAEKRRKPKPKKEKRSFNGSCVVCGEEYNWCGKCRCNQ